MSRRFISWQYPVSDVAKSRITFPDGTVVEIAKDTTPEQIQAILTTLRGTMPPRAVSQQETGKLIELEPTAEEIWEEGSNREKVALFVRNHFLASQWFSAIEVRDEQLQFVKRLVFGESSAIGTYLDRLHGDGLLDKAKRGKNVFYRITSDLQSKYPELHLDEVATLLRQE